MLERRPLLTKSVTTGIVDDDEREGMMAMRVKVLMKLKVMMGVMMMANEGDNEVDGDEDDDDYDDDEEVCNMTINVVVTA